MSESKTSQNRLRAADRQRQALELRKAGATFEAIAETLGYEGPSGAYRAVMTGLRKTLQEPSDELRKLELERLDAAQLAIYNEVKRGNFGAVDRLLRIMDRRARLLGLDARSSEPSVLMAAIAGTTTTPPTGTSPQQIWPAPPGVVLDLEELKQRLAEVLADATPEQRANLLSSFDALVQLSQSLSHQITDTYAALPGDQAQTSQDTQVEEI